MAWSTFGQKKKPTALKAGKSGRYHFTLHSEYKMREYHLSRQRVIRIIRSPHRTETGIVENTVAVMQPASVKTTAGKPAWNQEIWVMYKIVKSKSEALNTKKDSNFKFPISDFSQPQLRIISAWRYPGVSPERDPIPADILRELEARSEEDEDE